MISTKLISIDTSIFGKLAKDFYSRSKSHHGNAARFIRFVTNNGLIPYFSHHHIQELLQHNNDNIIYDRWSFIRKFPIIAWLQGPGESSLLGSIMEVHAAELSYILQDTSLNFVDLISKVKKDIVTYSSGAEFVDRFEFVYCELRRMGKFDIQKGKSIESLSHIRDPEIDNTKLTVLNVSKLKPFDDAVKWSKDYAKDLETSLRERGDPKLNNHLHISNKFVSQVLDDSKSLYKDNDLSLFEKFIVRKGVDLSQIDSKTTVGDLGYLAMYNTKMKIVADSFRLDFNEVKKISEKIPSWILWRELDEIIRKEKKAHGSNMLDKHMAILALYVDVFIVDKRVSECFRQLQNKMPILSKCFNRILKLSCYSELESCVGMDLTS